MLVRRLIGDVALAVLIAVPVTALARPAPVAPVPNEQNVLVERPLLALASASDRQTGFFR